MHKKNYYDNTYSYFKNGGLEIFACTSCKSKVSSKENFAMFYTFIIYSALNGVTVLVWEGVPAVLAIDIFFAFWGAPFFWILKWIYKQFRNPYFSLLSKHPVILKYKSQGYIFGMP